MTNRRYGEILAWLETEPGIDELIERFPGEWQSLRSEAAAQGRSGGEGLREYIHNSLKPVRPTRGHAPPQHVLVAQEVRRRMLLEILRQENLRAETGRASGTLRFNRMNAWILQRLFFEEGLRRKPVSMAAYRLLWPLTPQRSLLLPLVRRQGIYCFYSRPFLAGLDRIIGGRKCLEIGAGDGTLARLLRARGVEVTATDDFSWSAHVDFDATLVDRLDARRALRRHAPEVVICSWPPARNDFERHVFETDSVQSFVVITSSADADASDWQAYQNQSDFVMRFDRRMSRLVLPNGRNRVYIFTRRQPEAGHEKLPGPSS
ncbi:SAM-dependent methyltransferase [Nocardioides caldifontis]|uniref:SAM-dependent methyltransferase n=1 Tax=Nocardioides caldifontis TaxID=2588938 RepID=UPI0011E0055C|nr:SAM-dependent methyltransferase [Nocardioides caldifontis]